MQKEGDYGINTEVIYLSENSKTKNEEKRLKKENEEFGVEAKAIVDSRIYEWPSFFSVYFLLLSLGV